MKKLLFVFIFFTFALFLVACEKPVQLTAPEITLEGTVLKWNEIENASGYIVKINDEEVTVNDTSYNLKDLRLSSYKITVIAVGDGKLFLDSNPSNEINIQPVNKMELNKGTTTNNVVTYTVNVQSNADALGFVMELTFDNGKLTITEDKVKFANIIPNSWINDVNITDGKVVIALTGLDPINVRLLQTLVTLEFTVTDASGVVALSSFEIDNG